MTMTYCAHHGEIDSDQVCGKCLGPVCDECARQSPLKLNCPACKKKRRQKLVVFSLFMTFLVLGGASYPLFFSETARLQREVADNACSESLSYQLARHYLKQNKHVEARKELSRYLAECGESSEMRETLYAINSYLGNDKAALSDIEKLIESEPYNRDYWAWQGQTFESLNDPQRAVYSFRQALKIYPNLRQVPMNIVHLLQAQGKFCEAYLELNRYADVVPKVREDAQIRFMFKDFYQKGQCQDQFSTAKTVIHFPPGASSILLKAKFNGEKEATMVLDTGASFVSLSKSFARQIGVKMSGKPIQLLTANGIRHGELVQVDEIAVNSVVAKNVDVALSDQENYGYGAVGLLGMAFLSHFNVAIDSDSGELRLESRAVAEP